MNNRVMYLIIVLFTGLIVSVCGDEDALDDNSYYFGLLNGDEDAGVGREDKIETIQEEQPKLQDGLWKCGNCTNINESKVLFSETLELDTNYEDTGYELQIQLAVKNMRCIIVDAGAIEVRRISGACAGEDVSLSITQNCTVDVKIYE